MTRHTVYRPPPNAPASVAQTPVSPGHKVRAVEILKKLPVFSGLSEGEYYRVLAVCASTSVAEGQVLFRQGDPGDSMYVLLHGEIGISMEGRGTVYVMQPGEVLGEMGLVCDMRRSATAIARKQSVLLNLPSPALHQLLDRNTRLGYVTMRNIAAILAERLQAENDRYREPGVTRASLDSAKLGRRIDEKGTGDARNPTQS